MKKYIEASELKEMFRDDEMLSCDRPFDIYQWAENIIDECPPAKKAVELPLEIGQDVWTADGQHGTVCNYYFGRGGLQRIFATLDSGDRINFTPKGIKKDVFFSDPENSRSERVSDEQHTDAP